MKGFKISPADYDFNSFPFDVEKSEYSIDNVSNRSNGSYKSRFKIASGIHYKKFVWKLREFYRCTILQEQ